MISRILGCVIKHVSVVDLLFIFVVGEPDLFERKFTLRWPVSIKAFAKIKAIFKVNSLDRFSSTTIFYQITLGKKTDTIQSPQLLLRVIASTIVQRGNRIGPVGAEIKQRDHVL